MAKTLLLLILVAILFGVVVVKTDVINLREVARDTLGVNIGTTDNPGSDSESSGEPLVKLPILDKFTKSEPPQFPIQRTLVDMQDRPLEATVIAKSQGSLAVKRASDGKEFVVPLDKLCENDRKFFATIPDTDAGKFSAITRKSRTAGRRARWNYNMVGARNEAEQFGIPIFLLFTGTSWCPPCQVLEKEVLNTPVFQEFANGNLALAKITVPADRTLRGSDQALRDKYSVSSYPTVLLLTESGQRFYSKVGSSTNPEKFIADLEAAIKKGVSK